MLAISFILLKLVSILQLVYSFNNEFRCVKLYTFSKQDKTKIDNCIRWPCFVKMAYVRLFALIVALVLSYFNQTAASKRANDNFKTPLLGFTVLVDSFSKEFLTKCSSKVQQRIPVTDETRRHAIKTHIKRRYSKGKVPYYSNSNATFNVEIIRAGDVELNPGDVRNPCSVCGKSVARTHRALDCSTCK